MENEKKKNNKSLWIIIGIVAIAAIIVIAGIVSTALKVIDAATAPQEAGKEFVNLAASGNIPAAYDATSQEFQEVTEEEDLAVFLETFPLQPDTVTFTYFSFENNVAVISGTVEVGEETSPITMTLVKREKEWRVVNFSLEPEDVPNQGDDSEENAE